MEIDSGVQELVRRLQEARWATTDSGDGRSKFIDGRPVMEGALDFPHVFIRVEHPEELVEAADQLLRQVQEWTEAPFQIEASYDPANRISILGVLGLLDEHLK